MLTSKLTIKQRIIAVILYTAVFLVLCRWFGGDWSFLSDSTSKYNILFVSGALLLIFSSYIAEPFFTKPADVITNSIAIILALLGINKPEEFIGYKYLFSSAVLLLIFSIITILLSYFKKIKIFQNIFFEIITKIGQSKIIFSFIYLLTIVSYFKDAPFEFTFFLTFWVIFVSQFIVESIIIWLSKIWNYIINFKKHPEILGQAIGCENPFLYKIEIDYSRHKIKDVKNGELVCLSLDNSEVAVGIVIAEKQLLNKKWLTVYLFEENSNPLKINLKTAQIITDSNTIFSIDNAVYILNFDELSPEQKDLINNNYLYKNKDSFVGYVCEGSDINKIKFYSLVDSSSCKSKLLREGSVLKTKIYDQETLFQIIDGNTDQEKLEKHDVHGYLVGIAQKLGRYNQDKQELEIVKWVPNIYSPVFFDSTKCSKPSDMSIGKLPETDLEIIIKDPDSLVTHNTAILGILGIGKSCLTFELIKKIIASTEAKIICIDITNEYKNKLENYIDKSLIVADDENIFNSINTRFEYIYDEKGVKNHEKSGNQNQYREELRKDLYNFIFSGDKIPEDKKFSTDKRLRIYNPDYHKASKGEKMGYNVITSELTQAEKTRIIAEEIFVILMKIGLQSDKKAKILIVLEEAHSLVPEWNSTANEGDKMAVNGTAKIILQGRKYGLGSFIVTQRTANISKSILNQSNTIFALRVFDDTGKQFLENYIGSDYSNTLPTLEERRAIVVGKALKLKQPVIIELNNADNIMFKKDEK